MLDKKIIGLINSQINKELESAYLYLNFANYFTERGLKGFANWYNVQAGEEVDHANKFIAYLHDNNEPVELEDIKLADKYFDSIEEILSKGLQHEIYVTALINNIYKEATALSDFRTMKFLDWFITEQQEEEANAQELLDDYGNFVCDCGCGLFELNEKLLQRSK